MRKMKHKKPNPEKATVSYFEVTFWVEVEHKGAAQDARLDVEHAVANAIDAALKLGRGAIEGSGVKIIDAVDFGAEAE